MSDYKTQLSEFVSETKSFADAIRKLTTSVPREDDPEMAAQATVAIVECRRILLEALNACPAMSIVFNVPPLASAPSPNATGATLSS